MIIPVEVQKPNKPDSAMILGEADDRLDVASVAELVGIPEGCLVGGKVIRSKKHGDRWSLVANIKFVTASF
jgi:hypothetical protein